MKKVALITGADGAIGRELCAEFTNNGYYVIATDKMPSSDVIYDLYFQLDLEIICHSTDVLTAFIKDLRRILDSNGLNVLVNNAAIQILGATSDIAITDWQLTMDVNLTAPFILIQSLLPELTASQGSVVNITSVHAKATKPEFVSYATSKAALDGLTRALAVDLGGCVRVNAINPAATDTPMLREGFLGNKNKFDELKSVHPVGRIANPKEIASAAVYLSSSQAQFITGLCMDLDGGVLSRLHDPV